ncbi:hypothetical protein GCM10008942_03480 [Rhizomicrobium electricum]|uniref:BioF2-like acetyltransferase domain-containing protein n=1 Tax=Rhizomicrobium electricum TaxID=480070 RepID=A0ABN1E3B1_9PROT|nr:hypothetical protein [Rhizomicrobium electricum]
MRTEVAYFAVPASPPHVDVLKLCDLPAPYPNVANEYRPTILIDLTQPEDALLAAVNAHTRKVLRQAVREGVTVASVLPLNQAIWDHFLESYWKLWRRKANAGALGIGQIRDLIAQHRFELTVSRSAEGHILSWHAYVRTPERVRLHTTISDMDPTRDSKWNNMVGRAHRLHHWQDMLRFKADGVKIYDFGGVYRGTEDREQINIAHFKQSFGGYFADTYDAVVPLTLKGRLALTLIAHVGADFRSGGKTAGAPA